MLTLVTHAILSTSDVEQRRKGIWTLATAAGPFKRMLASGDGGIVLAAAKKYLGLQVDDDELNYKPRDDEMDEDDRFRRMVKSQVSRPVHLLTFQET